MGESLDLSVVLPTWQAAATLDGTLAAVTRGAGDLAIEVVVCDGGSTDGTPALAERQGAHLITAPRGRGVQLAAGAAAARGDWLLFLHADTQLAADWGAVAGRFMAAGDNRSRAAVFRFALDDGGVAPRLLERLVAWRWRLWALPYGDQGLLIGRALYDALGGFRPLPLMEDVDMVRRLGRRRLVLLDSPALTSAARYRREGYVRRPLRNLVCLSLYFMGVAPRLIGRLYG